jgi:uncharacterized protein (DUF433 family)
MAIQIAAPQVNAAATEHPHIVLIQKMDRQQAVIRGTRMPVWIIAGFYKAGDTMDDILVSYPHLSPASVYDAISYYHDHQVEIEAEISTQRIENVLKQTGGVMDERGFIHFPDLPKTT